MRAVGALIQEAASLSLAGIREDDDDRPRELAHRAACLMLDAACRNPETRQRPVTDNFPPRSGPQQDPLPEPMFNDALPRHNHVNSLRTLYRITHLVACAVALAISSVNPVLGSASRVYPSGRSRRRLSQLIYSPSPSPGRGSTCAVTLVGGGRRSGDSRTCQLFRVPGQLEARHAK